MTSKFVQDTCLLLRHDGCKKGTYPVKGQGCKPSQGRMGQGGSSSGSGRGKAFAKGALLGAAGTGALALGGAAAGAAWMNTRHGQRTIGEVQQKLGKAGQAFAANGAERYAKNAMTKEEVKKEYDRRLAKQERESNPQPKKKKDPNALSDRESRRLEKMLA